MTPARRTRALLSACIAALVGLSSSVALACPVCAAHKVGGAARMIALGAFILLPFAVVIVVARAVRRSEQS